MFIKTQSIIKIMMTIIIKVVPLMPSPSLSSRGNYAVILYFVRTSRQGC